MPGLKDWFDVFRCGTHIDRFGREVTVTRGDIDAAIASYQKDSAPIVVGHPSLNAPAYGWIGAFRRVGDTVQAKASTVADEFADLVKRHLYKNRSLAFGPGLKFRHVGFLGAQAPAVKGLQDISFSTEEEFMDVEFSESTTQAPEAAAAEAPAETLPAESAAVSQELADAGSDPAGQDQEKAAETAGEETAEARPDSLADELAALKAELKAAKEKNAKLQTDLSALQRSSRRAEFAADADLLISRGAFTEAQRPQLVEFMECLDGQDNYQFSEGSMPVLQRFKELFADAPKHSVSFAEFAGADRAAAVTADDSVTLAKRARAYIDAEAKEGRTVSASAAVQHIMKG